MLGLLTTSAIAVQADEADLLRQVEELRNDNAALRGRLSDQERKLESVMTELDELRTAARSNSTGPTAGSDRAPVTSGPARVILSGQGAVGLFSTGSAGSHPNTEFTLDELRLDVDAMVTDNVYAFVELNFATREATDLYAEPGEAYIDFEGVSRLWGNERQLSLRAGRLDVPFGEEYLTRYAIDDPLISHSLADIWGVDEGVELYGALGPVYYVAAVQNGGNSDVHDFNGDKSVALRLGYDPTRWLHVGISGMRTGDLNASNEWSALWFGNGFFRSIGSNGTSTFSARAVQGDLQLKLARGHIHLAGGYANYTDNDPLADNRRDLYFYSVEGVHDVTSHLYAGLRFSQIFAEHGYPIVGQGNFGQYFFGPMTDNIWRLSLGLGYRVSDGLVLKGEYSFERGKLTNGGTRTDEDMVSGQVAFKF